MLQGINRLGKSWVGRAVVAVLFGFLIISFAIWGIGDIFRGAVRTQVATVGGSEVSADAFRTAYQSEFQALARRARQAITPEQARALGLEQRVLARLVAESALDQTTKRLGLSVSDAVVVRTIQTDPTFQGSNGAFDRAQFTEILRSNGLSEAQYVREQRAVVARQQVSEAVSGSLPVPLAMREAVHRYGSERRSAEFVSLPASSVGDVPAPTDAELQAFYDGRKALYRAPEYRSANLLVLDPEAIAKPEAVSDADALLAYERIKDTRFGTPERRVVQQIGFPTRTEADAAAQRIKAGASFEEIAKERGIDEAALTLGTFTKADMVDRAAADAAFALAEGAVSDPVDGRFGPVLVRAAKVEPGTLKPFAEVAAELKREAALERARNEMQAVHDAIEDQRSGAKALAAIAKERNLTLLRAEGVDRSGSNKTGEAATGVPEPNVVLPAIFRSDVGADTEAVRTKSGGYVWFEVTGVEPARERPLSEVKERVAADWRADAVSRRLAEKARDLVARLGRDEPIAAVAAELGLPVRSGSELTRGRPAPDLPAAVVTRIFATPVGRAADAAADDGRVVFKVTGASMPPFVTTTQQAASVEDQLRQALADDLLGQYVAHAEKTLGVATYPENLRRAIGGES